MTKSHTERAYDTAVGRCIEAMLALRRFNGQEALSELRSAIRMIEDAQQRARREERIDYRRIQPASLVPEPFSGEL